MRESEGELVVPPLLLDLLPQPRVLLVQLLLHLQEIYYLYFLFPSLDTRDPTTDTVIESPAD